MLLDHQSVAHYIKPQTKEGLADNPYDIPVRLHVYLKICMLPLAFDDAETRLGALYPRGYRAIPFRVFTLGLQS